MVKGSDDCTSVEVEYILTLTDNNGMTILYKTRERIATGKPKGLHSLSYLTFTRKHYTLNVRSRGKQS